LGRARIFAMVRIAAAFVFLCMIAIAGSAGLAAYLLGVTTATEAAVIALALLTTLAVCRAATDYTRGRTELEQKIADLARGVADLARQVGDLGRRVIAVEGSVAAKVDPARSAIAPLSAEIAELGTLVRDLAESVAAHDAALVELAASSARAGSNTPRRSTTTSPATVDAAELGEPEPGPNSSVAGMNPGELVSMVRSAIEADRVDLYLQPIVTLPQRRVRHYEAVARLRTEDGQTLAAADLGETAALDSLLPRLNILVIRRCAEVVQRLVSRNRDLGLFCPVSAASMTDGAFFSELSTLVERNRALAAALVLEFGQEAVRSMGPLETESLTALAELGLRFSLDRVVDLRLDPRELAARGFRFVKVPAVLLLDHGGHAATDIHPADLSHLLARFGIDLIAEGVCSESTVVDLLDYELRFGQGALFSPPRPVRSQALPAVA
jgi:cyclic-di-GMP phosphodiesterase TipF (flagellum assembly factor)